MSAQTLKLMAFDVDGVFTDGTLYYGPDGDHLKAFSILDGLGLKLLRHLGIEIAIVTGRRSPMVTHRFTELGADHIIQAREDKGQAIAELAETLALDKKELGYMGDDYPDVSAAKHVGFFASVPNAPISVQDLASFVSSARGGEGAVREVCEHILVARGLDPLQVYQEMTQ